MAITANSVVRIMSGEEFLGSGFVVAEGPMIATCEHVWSAAKGEPVLIVYASQEETAVSLLIANEDRDLALLSASVPAELIDTPPLVLEDKTLTRETPFTAVGHSWKALPTAKDWSGTIAGYDGPFGHYILSASINPGDSGCPLMSGGLAAGVVRSKHKYNDGQGKAIQAKDLKQTMVEGAAKLREERGDSDRMYLALRKAIESSGRRGPGVPSAQTDPRRPTDCPPNPELAQTFDKIAKKILEGKCLPIIGSHAFEPALKIQEEVIRAIDSHAPAFAELAEVFQHCLPDLQRKHDLADRIKGISRTDRQEHASLHQTLAEIEFPIYLTTAYDTALEWALAKRNAVGHVDLPLWGPGAEGFKRNWGGSDFFAPDDRGRKWHLSDLPEADYTPAKPLVYHLLGTCDDGPAMAVSEDDHLDVIEWVQNNRSSVPNKLVRAITSHAILLLGFRLGSWELRAVMRIIRAFRAQGRPLVYLQVPLGPESGEDASVQRLLTHSATYMKGREFTLYPGSLSCFLYDLKSAVEGAQSQGERR